MEIRYSHKKHNRIIFSVILLFLLQGCHRQFPDKIVIPSSFCVTDNAPVIIDYIWMDGCTECQASEAARWIRRQKDLARMGDDYKAQIICILNSRTRENESTISQQEFIARTYNDLHFIYTANDVQLFTDLNPDIRHRKSFTCLTNPNGHIIHKGGNPKKDLEAFKKYTDFISNYNINL